jgi:hypothetical protein
MPILQSFRDGDEACSAHLRMDDDSPCLIRLSQNGVVVKRSKLGLFGATVYDEQDESTTAMTAKALTCLFPRQRVPNDMRSPVLRAFVNAAMHCTTLADVAEVYRTAIREAEWASGTTIDKISS